jgi:CRISPR system Cascade subunit CasE
MYLSQLSLNVLNQQTKHDIGNPYELHRTIMRAFPNPLPTDERVLFRVETSHGQLQALVLVQSQSKPNWEAVEKTFDAYFMQSPQVKSLDGIKIESGDILHFRLRANPSKRVLYGEEGHSQRISLFSESDRLDWLVRKASQSGFTITKEQLLIRDAPYRTFFITHPQKTRKAIINMVDYNGLLQVDNPTQFLEHVSSGIGPAKGLGCGLLSFARI